jgi:hypothetical protein
LHSCLPHPDRERRQHRSTESWRTLFKVAVTINTPMETLLIRIMLSVASETWRKEPTLSRYTDAPGSGRTLPCNGLVRPLSQTARAGSFHALRVPLVFQEYR